MRKQYLYSLAIAVITLFFYQMAGTLVESIYILDLLNTALDEKALGLLFFFSPILFIPFRKRIPRRVVWAVFCFLLIGRGITPYLSTTGRMLASGVGIGSVLLLLPLIIVAQPKSESIISHTVLVSIGIALGVGFSVLLRTINFTIDYSLTGVGSWVGWILALILGVGLVQVNWVSEPQKVAKARGLTSAIFGLFMILTLVTFIFSAPGVLARWTGGNYALIVSLVSLMVMAWSGVILIKPAFITRISSKWIFFWNLLFGLSLLGTIFTHTVSFPTSTNSPTLIVSTPTLLQQVPLILTILLLPVIFVAAAAFVRTIRDAAPSPRKFVPGMILGSTAFVLLVFMFIFTNVWGYVEPVSPFFRNKFWLPFALIVLGLTSSVLLQPKKEPTSEKKFQATFHWGWAFFFVVVFLVTGITALMTDRVSKSVVEKKSLVVMTYNIQQANDESGNKSYKSQLELIQRVSPDFLALQESDSARIALNNNDYVQYYASKLGYYSYYGPKTVSGTYGTAILSRYPLNNPHTIFSYSDQDEIGTAVVEIVVDGKVFTIFNVHPAGSDAAMEAFAKALLTHSDGKLNVIALGDFNLREGDSAFEMVAGEFTNAWTSFYPSGISEEGIDMSGRERIDHIFISPHLSIRNPVYVLAPESATDHPVHWAEVFWSE